MKKKKGGLSVRNLGVWLLLILGSLGLTSDVAQLYSRAFEFAETGKKDFAFMHFNELQRDYPTSGYREKALFAVGEYYFLISGFQDAEKTFRSFLDEYPNSKQRLYALAYLFNMAQRNNKGDVARELEKQIVDVHRVSFVFRETKEIAYRSPLRQNYRTDIYIDHIEFYVEGKLFAKVSY
ncbi:MAG: outer membrane protein assembly factor BamD [Candidatus Omnitrophica bacterium]|nr:outer membrane protein assembly factor BamD [Candidatus Omnitrophota bacterium]